MMEYEVVKLAEKRVAGLTIRTGRERPDASEKIGGLWHEFFGKGVYDRIPDKVSGKTIGLYNNYERQEKGDYDMYVCCEVSPAAVLPEGLAETVIPSGTYAKFIVHGNMVTAVVKFWESLWEMGMDRSFSGDFEEYQPGEDMENCEIHVYIALNEKR